MNGPRIIDLSLTALEVKVLLDNLESLLKISNRDNKMVAILYERIATQFYGIPVKVNLYNEKEDK